MMVLFKCSRQAIRLLLVRHCFTMVRVTQVRPSLRQAAWESCLPVVDGHLEGTMLKEHALPKELGCRGSCFVM